MGRPPLAIVGSTTNLPPPPRQLGAHGLELWSAIQREYYITDPGGIELLAQACSGLDRAEQLGERIGADGAIVHTRSGPKPHPALAAELAARAFVCRQLERLGLNLEAVRPIGRPSGRRNYDAD
jgi:hypothetical protein